MSINRLALKLKRRTQEHIKQNVLAEQEKFYSEGKPKNEEGSDIEEEEDNQ
jgi:hypothetical protein